MTDPQWERAWQIYSAAQQLPENQRQSYIKSSSDDPEILEEVAVLLEQFESEQQPSRIISGARIGRYEISDELGRGGMGQVYKARDTELGRVVALKFLAYDVPATTPALERLVREAQAASALNHPHIVTVYEVVRSEGHIAIAMEFVDGKDLRSIRGTASAITDVVQWGRQAAQALAAAHASNIIHRDIKPENLMVRQDGYLKVLDFGLARRQSVSGQTSASTNSGFMAGTWNYMSPEQARAEKATSASDVFSLGVVLYELITGNNPFVGESPVDTAHAIAYREPKPPKSLNPKVPPALSELIAAMLAKNPAERPSAAEVDRLLDSNVSAERPGSRWRVWLLIAGRGAACLALGAFVWILRDRIAPEKPWSFRQVTTQTSENRVTAAALSPDGATLAFAALGGAIQLQRMSDGFVRPRAVPAGLRVDRIAWFDDGSELVISGPGQDGQTGVWILPVQGGPARLIVPAGRDAIPSPDGRHIALTNVAGSAIWVVDRNGGNGRIVRDAGDAGLFSALTWSPDSKRVNYQRRDFIAFDQGSGEGAAQNEKHYRYIFESLDVASARLVGTVKDVVMTSACTLADGRVIFLRWTSFGKTASYDLWELTTDSRTGNIVRSPRKLAGDVNYEMFSLSASRDGKQIAAISRTSRPKVYVADVAAGQSIPRFVNARQLTFSDSSNFPHAWTAAGDAVILESNRTGKYGLYRQKLDQREAEPLVLAQTDSVLAQLSGDGKWILYVSMRDGKFEKLMRVDVNGGTPKPIPINGAPDEFRCALEAGAQCVLRSTENSQFVFYELDPIKGQGRELARTSASATVRGDWDISPDGKTVAIPNHDSREIRLIPLSGAAPGTSNRILAPAVKDFLNGVTWAADGKGLYANVVHSTTSTILFVDLEGHATQLVEPIDTFIVSSPDGKHVAYPVPTIVNNVYLIGQF